MANGGGAFSSMNKILPGAYINFVSVNTVGSELSERGVATIAMEMDWGQSGMFAVTLPELKANALKLFGYNYTDSELKPVRELFRHAQKVWFYRLNTAGVKASGVICSAKHPGTRGNQIAYSIAENENSTDSESLYDVTLYWGNEMLESYNAVSSVEELSASSWVDWTPDAALTVTAKTNLTGGTNGTTASGAHAAYLAASENYSFNVMACYSSDTTIIALYVAFVRRMREEVGKKFQVVILNDATADYEGVISLKNAKSSAGTFTESNLNLIPWVTGLQAGTAVNKSCSNVKYDGEYVVNTGYTQTDLETAISEGSFCFHSVDGEVRVLSDINTLTTYTDQKNSDFKHNQTIRVVDQIANDIAALFASKYLGRVANDDIGRTALWADVVRHHEKLLAIRAIEGFSSSDIVVEEGETKTAVTITDVITPVNCIEQLYMTVYVA